MDSLAAGRVRRCSSFTASGVVAALVVLVINWPAGGAISADGIQVNPLNPAVYASTSPARLAEDRELDPRAAALAPALRQALERLAEAENQSVAAGAKTAAAMKTVVPSRQMPGDDVEVRMRPGGGVPLEIRVRGAAKAVPNGVRVAVDDEVVARGFLRANAGLLRLDNPDEELRLVRRFGDELGRRHVRFSQEYQGLRVWPCELTVHLTVDGEVDRVNGAFSASPRKLVARPIVDLPTAVQLAQDAIPGGAGVEPTMTELLIHATPERSPRLAWKVDLPVAADAYWLVVVDALNGAVLRAYNEVRTSAAVGSGVDLFGNTRPLNIWEEGGSYYLVDTSKRMFDPASAGQGLSGLRGVITIRSNWGLESLRPANYVSADPDFWPDADAVSASWGVSEAYDYFLERFGWDSFDGQGSSIAVVLGLGADNAFWYPALRLMAFGDARPYAGMLDVVAHEFTHGVTDTMARLEYRDQAGALSEAMSDVFGELVEARTFGAADWVTGVELGTLSRNHRVPGSIVNPATGTGYPQKMSEYSWTSGDNGGVHTNCTIISHAVYLLAEGLSGAIGLPYTERILYRALTTHLAPQSGFADVRQAFLASAEELFGIGSVEVQKIAESFDAAQIYEPPGASEPPTSTLVNAPDSTVFLWKSVYGTGYRVARMEAALGDPAVGTILSSYSARYNRPSVSGDGELAAFVNSAKDLVLVSTRFVGIEAPLGSPGTVHSVAMSPDGQRYGFVFLNFDGSRDNTISIIDLATNDARTVPLTAPLYDGGTVEVLYADALDFTPDGRFLVYDAVNRIEYADGTAQASWSIYALDIETGAVIPVVPPMPPYDVGAPSMSRCSPARMTFTAVDASTDESVVFAVDLFTGDLAAVAYVDAEWPSPCYTGDDGAIVYSAPDYTASLTGRSLYRQELAADHITPIGGSSLWLWDGDLGFIYRRGIYTPPQRVADLDNDGIPDDADNCPSVVNPGQWDSDSDGLGDQCDGCPGDPLKTEPGSCGCGVSDTDSDGDSVADCIDECSADPNKVEGGACGCGVADTDTDGDRTPDCVDDCPEDASKTEPGACGCGVPESDGDDDGVPDCTDNCPSAANTDQADADADGAGDVCDESPQGPRRGFCGAGLGIPVVAMFCCLSVIRLTWQRSRRRLWTGR